MAQEIYPVDGLTDDNVEKYIKEKKSFSIKNSVADDFFDYKVETYISFIFRLKRFQHLSTPVNFVVQELIANANKANLKRVFFQLNDYNIKDKNKYEDGVKHFTDFIKHGKKELQNKLPDLGLYVKVIFKKYHDNTFQIYIINNSLLTFEEKNRIKEKLSFYEHAKEEPQKSLKIMDETEGAGMGIFLSLKLLGKAGIDADCLSIGTHEDKTIAMLKFNYDQVKPPPYNIIAQEILKELETLPKYPENINSILKNLKNPDVTITEIANNITKDPALSADLLKLVNSAEFTITRKIASIREAINFVGLKGLKNLLYSYGAIKTINSRFGSIPEVWAHSHKTALYCSKIAKYFKLDKNTDEYFTAGLLHDIGKIVLMNFDEKRAAEIERICRRRGVDMPVMEEIIMGLSHARIGGKIAQFWDFPPSLVEAISYHHEPNVAKTNLPLVYTVYLSNILALTPKDQLSIYEIEPIVAKHFLLNSTDDLVILIEKLESV